MNIAQKIVKEIWSDLNGRGGCDMSDIDDEIKEEIKATWERIALNNMTSPDALKCPDFWLVVGDDKDVVMGYSTDDGNGGEAARTEANDYINEILSEEESAGTVMHLVGVVVVDKERFHG